MSTRTENACFFRYYGIGGGIIMTNVNIPDGYVLVDEAKLRGFIAGTCLASSILGNTDTDDIQKRVDNIFNDLIEQKEIDS